MPISSREYLTIKIDSLIDYQPLSDVCKSCHKAQENGICTGHSGTFYKEMCPLSDDFKGVNYHG